MQLDDLTSAGWLRRWHLIDGQARCPFDAVDPVTISLEDRDGILAQNASVRDALAAVEEYEGHLSVAAAPEPVEPGEDASEEEREAWAEAHQEWMERAADAADAIEHASDATKALAQRRTGQDENGEPYAPDADPVDTIIPITPEETVPDGPTNSDWRVGLILWGRFDEVESAVVAARDSGDVRGVIAWQRWEYANNVFRAELMSLRETFGFSEADVDESLRRAAGVAAAARAAA